MLATPSPSANGGSVGGPSGWPLMCAKPLMLSATVPKPGRGLYGTGLAVARAAHHHQARVDRVQHVRAQAPLLEGAGAEALDEHVRVLDQLLEQRGAFRLAEVDGHEALVAVDERPPQADAVLLPAERAQGVPLGVLHLDDVRPEVRQERADHGTGEQDRRVDDAQTP